MDYVSPGTQLTRNKPFVKGLGVGIAAGLFGALVRVVQQLFLVISNMPS